MESIKILENYFNDEYLIFKESIRCISYLPIGSTLDLNEISDHFILIDCLNYVVASKYPYFKFWIFQIIPIVDLKRFFFF